MKEDKPQVGIRTIAKKLGLSKTTVGAALNHDPKVRASTRERVERAAREMGYIPDARLATWMKKVRQADEKSLLPLVWISTTEWQECWARYGFLAPYFLGAQERAREMGYRLEEFWSCAPGMTEQRMSGILRAQGVEAAIVTYPAAQLKIDWSRLAAVSLGGALLSPRLDTIMTDHYFNLSLALKKVRRAGYRRIGIFLAREMDRLSSHLLLAAAHYFYVSDRKAKQLPPLFYKSEEGDRKKNEIRALTQWMDENKPEVIICHSAYLVRYLQEAGYRVPEDVGCVHLATDDDVPDWAGIHSQKRLIGAKAVELVISRLQRGDFGPPKSDTKTLVKGKWHDGWTLEVPRG